MQTATSGVYQELGQRLRDLPQSINMANSQELYDLMLEGKYAYSSDRTGNFMKTRKLKECDVVYLPDTYLSSGIGMAVHTGAVYTKYFDKV